MDFDAVSFLRDNGVQYWEEGENVQRGWVGVRCPFCYDHSNHGGFNVAGGYYSCWRCGGHSLEDVVMELLHISFADASKMVLDYSARGVLLQGLNKKKVARAKSVEMPGELLTRFHKAYLRRRGFDPAHIEEKYKVLGTGPVGEWKLRILIPIIYKGVMVSFTGRDITNKQRLRYKTLSVEESVVNPKFILYNIDNCRAERVVLVEGPFDVWRMGDGYCAGLGTQLTDQQIRLLSSYKKVLILFDAEPEAQKRAERYASMLSSLGVEKVFVVDAEIEKDPADLSEERAEEIRREVAAL